jgi:DNA-binding transcriptional MerR regulator
MEETMQGFSRKEVALKLGITPRTVWHYTQMQIVSPEVANPKGKGTTRLYSWKNIMEIAVARELARCGISLENVRQIMRAPRLRSGRTSFDPWDPKDESPMDQRFYLIVYNPSGENPRLITTGGDPDSGVKIGGKKAWGDDVFSSAIVVDITAVRQKLS